MSSPANKVAAAVEPETEKLLSLGTVEGFACDAGKEDSLTSHNSWMLMHPILLPRPLRSENSVTGEGEGSETKGPLLLQSDTRDKVDTILNLGLSSNNTLVRTGLQKSSALLPCGSPSLVVIQVYKSLDIILEGKNEDY